MNTAEPSIAVAFWLRWTVLERKCWARTILSGCAAWRCWMNRRTCWWVPPMTPQRWNSLESQGRWKWQWSVMDIQAEMEDKVHVSAFLSLFAWVTKQCGSTPQPY